MAESAAAKVVEILSEPYMIAEHSLSVSASVGIGCFPRDGDSVQALLRHADAEMYRAKHLLRRVSTGTSTQA
jgi:diguanylate cyclase